MGFKVIKKVEFCSAAELPEKAGVDEANMLAIEDRKFSSETEAISTCDQMEDTPRFVMAQALVPKIPAEAAKAIEKFRSSIPAMREKLTAILQPDPETGEPTWRQKFEGEIITRVKGKKCATEPCDNCGSRIATAFITEWLCPVCKAHPFMATNTDLKDLAAKEEKIATLRSNVEDADQKILEMEREAAKNSCEFKVVWLVLEKDTLAD